MLDRAKSRALPVLNRIRDMTSAAQACCGVCRTCATKSILAVAVAPADAEEPAHRRLLDLHGIDLSETDLTRALADRSVDDVEPLRRHHEVQPLPVPDGAHCHHGGERDEKRSGETESARIEEDPFVVRGHGLPAFASAAVPAAT